MDEAKQKTLETEVEAAEAEVSRLRREHAELARDLRLDPNDEGREALSTLAATLAAARARAEEARTALEVYAKKGSVYGLVQDKDRVVGRIGVAVKAGVNRSEREQAIDEALSLALTEAADELGVVLTAVPMKYTRELPGRDAEGRTVLEVIGRVEGDRLVPAVSRKAQKRR